MKKLINTPYLESINGYAFKMIPVKGGTFDMGDEYGDLWDACRPVRKDLPIGDFYLAEFPVTNRLWKEVMGTYNAHSEFKIDEHPVESVSWDDICRANGFLEKLNRLPEVARRNAQDGLQYRLPTEAQWEYAARGGSHKFCHPLKYAGSNQLKEVGWYNKNSHQETKPVGLKLANELGLYDMSGNVWEWCADVWHGSYQGAPKDGTAWLTGGESTRRVLRGGSWVIDDDICRVSDRSGSDASGRIDVIGFRVSRY